jgi:hypothetical protein
MRSWSPRGHLALSRMERWQYTRLNMLLYLELLADGLCTDLRGCKPDKNIHHSSQGFRYKGF